MPDPTPTDRHGHALQPGDRVRVLHPCDYSFEAYVAAVEPTDRRGLQRSPWPFLVRTRSGLQRYVRGAELERLTSDPDAS